MSDKQQIMLYVDVRPVCFGEIHANKTIHCLSEIQSKSNLTGQPGFFLLTLADLHPGNSNVTWFQWCHMVSEAGHSTCLRGSKGTLGFDTSVFPLSPAEWRLSLVFRMCSQRCHPVAQCLGYMPSFHICWEELLRKRWGWTQLDASF